MDLHPNNTDAFIIQCIQNARQNLSQKDDILSTMSASTEENSLLLNYLQHEDESNGEHSFISSNETDTLSTISFCSDTLTHSVSEEEDGIISEFSRNSTKSLTSIGTSINGDTLSKSFLQLKGIAVGNFNMRCNFHISAAIRIMIQYNLTILAIQEHTPWNRELSEVEIASIERHCDKWGYFVTLSKLQILIIDKQLTACHCETMVFEEGRVMKSRFEVSMNNYVTFVPVYGIPHSGGEKNPSYSRGY